MRYHQYKGVVEREYKMSLRKIMHQICIVEGLNAVEGAKKLGIAKGVFVHWRRYFRFEKRQVLFDETIQELVEVQNHQSEEPKRKEIPQRRAGTSTDSLQEMEEVIDCLIDYYRYIHYTSDGLALKSAKLPLYQFSKTLIADYRNGDLIKELQVES